MRCRWVFVWAMLVSPAIGDVIRLKSGPVLRGEVKRDDGAWIITADDGKATRVEAHEIASMELGTSTSQPTTLPDADTENLASLRRSVESIDNIDQILQRYQRFIDSRPSDKVLRDAQADIAMWNDHKAGGLVKFDGEWVTAAERDERMKQSLAMVEEARTLMRQGREKDADPILLRAMEVDPENPAAMFLRGVRAYAQNQLPVARKCFEMTRDALPNHGPSLANLAVILWRQDAIMPAVNYYDQAMAASPGERAILNNVAEAMQLVPSRFRDEPPIARMTERFVAQDHALQESLKEQGLYRWGSTWVDDKQMEMLSSAEADIREKLNEIEQQFDRVQSRIDRIDEDIEANKREMRRLEATSYYRDREGRLVRKSLPSVYYDIKEDNEQLLVERKEQEARLDEFRAAAKAVESRLPVPRYTGVQKILGVEYAPILVNAAEKPATQPEGENPKSETRMTNQ